MQPYEREMFLYPRACATCHLDDGSLLSQCNQCQSVFYCCDQHLPSDHADHCKDLKLLLDLNVEQSKKGRIDCMLPHELLKKFEEFPSSLKVSEFFKYVNYSGNIKGLTTLIGVSRHEDGWPNSRHGYG